MQRGGRVLPYVADNRAHICIGFRFRFKGIGAFLENALNAPPLNNMGVTGEAEQPQIPYSITFLVLPNIGFILKNPLSFTILSYATAFE